MGGVIGVIRMLAPTPPWLPRELFVTWRAEQRAYFLCGLVLQVPALRPSCAPWSAPAYALLQSVHARGRGLRTPRREAHAAQAGLRQWWGRYDLRVGEVKQEPLRQLLGGVLEVVYQLPPQVPLLPDPTIDRAAGPRRATAWLTAYLCELVQHPALLPRHAVTDHYAAIALGYDAPPDARAAVSAALLGGYFDAVPALCTPWPWIRISKAERKKRAKWLRTQGRGA